ncbi:MAG: N-acetylmuramoyl-L-alanine amidase [Treponemataceae bacterium]
MIIFMIFSAMSTFAADEKFVETKPKDFVSLTDASKKMGATLFYDPFSKSCTLQKNGNTLSFKAEQDIAVLNYRKLIGIQKPIFYKGQIFVSKSLIDEAELLFISKQSESFFKIGAVLIDPGHGGKDPGTIGVIETDGKKQFIYEKDIVLSVGKELHEMLVSKYPDKKILLTRSTDVFLTLEQRVEIANSVKLAENEAIVYVSIHANSAFDKKASGFEVWYLSPGYRRDILTEKDANAELLPILNSMMEEEYTTESILIAKFIHDGMQKQIGTYSKGRGLKAEEWFVVRNTKMPSVLVEVGFVSNVQEALYLADKNYLHKISLGIYNGVASFITHFEQSRGFTNSK